MPPVSFSVRCLTKPVPPGPPHRPGLRRRVLHLAAAVLALLVLAAPVAGAQTPKAAKGPTTRILFVLDGSGSMRAKWESSVRMEVAKTLLGQLVDSLDAFPDLQLGLRVYGHQFPSDQKNCEDSKLEVAFAPRNAGAIRKRLGTLTFQGVTPITYALTQAAHDFPADRTARNVVIIITDGLESCQGDLCAAAAALAQKKVFLKPFIIGIGAEENYARQFQCVGQFYNAADIRTFRVILQDIITQTLRPTTVQIGLLDGAGRPTETNVNLTLRNHATDQIAYNYVHFLLPGGQPDFLDIDPLQCQYDLTVNTLPPVKVEKLPIRAGRANLINVKAAQGTLWLQPPPGSGAAHVQVLVRQAGQTTTLVALPVGTRQKLLAGTYDLELLTLPRTYRPGVVIKAGETLALTYATPGILSIPTDLPGYGSLYQLQKDGAQTWVTNLPENSSRLNLPLQPGNYRLCFRTKNALSSRFTDAQNFTIQPGGTTTVRIFKR